METVELLVTSILRPKDHEHDEYPVFGYLAEDQHQQIRGCILSAKDGKEIYKQVDKGKPPVITVPRNRLFYAEPWVTYEERRAEREEIEKDT